MLKQPGGKTRSIDVLHVKSRTEPGSVGAMSSENSATQLVVTVLGSGTSQGVPMIGCRCPVCRSTDPRDNRTRSSIFLAAPQARILVDTTPDLRQQALREGLDHVDAVLFTHPHADHLMGFDDLRRFCEMQGMALPIYGSQPTLAQIQRTFPYAFDLKSTVPGYVHVVPHVVTAAFELGGIGITPLPVPHGAVSTLGFLFAHGGRKLLAYLSDCASVPEPIRALVEGVEVLIIDGLRDKAHPTHLTVSGAVQAAAAIGAGRSFITHQTHEKRHVDRQRDLPAGIDVAYDGMRLAFDLAPA
jgi:phosphoribosyl 1,2-cyclic phosphate phosphodiesterase